ncbi:SpoIIE family protein phosphatase [Arthrobacter zhaoxinii]|uniref:SpoIIE family protein phosphatase n=1 Tax=Arthrobacter zhaoxinii TaxID=2964616 RepID=UPI0021070365|nr:SpoIIE family protein phosphatase [Arthrobacter zhaoxinii]MCQ2001834.1 SpoIIE family protein phosphatase [Arthrobacter zhaoxinii]
MAASSWKHSVRISTEGDGHVQEDTCGYAAGTAWVIDGASVLLPQLGLPGPSDPAWYARNLDLLLTDAAVAAGPASGVCSAPEVLAEALTRMDQLAGTVAGEERIRFPSAALCLAQLTRDGVEILALADCHAVVELEDGSSVHVTHEPADIRIGTEHSADPVRERELRVLDRQLRNTPGRLWVARREPEAAYQAHTVRLGPARRVVLASDGAWRAVELGIVDGPDGFLMAAASPVAAQELLLALRTLQAELGEDADDATILTLERISP